MDRPVYFCGPPVAQQTISVTRYLNPYLLILSMRA
jgi:hypothetical protein